MQLDPTGASAAPRVRGHLEEPEPPRSTYAAAGVDIAAGEEAVERIRKVVGSTFGPEVIGGIGGFGGAFALDKGRWREPVLVASTDGVGTKLQVAAATGRFDTVGVDLVAMCVDDLVCSGAQPLFLLDYIATGKLDPDRVSEVVSGVAQGCRQAGCALLGGEMAEHHGAMAPGELDIAGFAVGVVDRAAMLGPERVKVGDVLVGLASPGLRSNGYTLARHVLLERAGRRLGDPAWEGAQHSLADELLRPSVIYSPAVLGAVSTGAVHAAAHITGGGIPGNLSRVLPEGCSAVVMAKSWEEPPIFGEIRHWGNVAEDEMRKVFNLGIGMVLVVEASAGEMTIGALRGSGVHAVIMGEVIEGDRGVVFDEEPA